MESNGKADIARLLKHGSCAHFWVEISRKHLLRRILTQLLVLIFCINLCGCISFYSYHPVQFSVRDAETDEPISGAEIGVRYGYVIFAPINAPKPDSAKADANGRATVRVASNNPDLWTMAADGYIPPDFGTLMDAIRRDSDSGVQLKLYRLPEPKITVVVPDGYRGPLAIEFSPESGWVQGEVGKRDFVFTATRRGFVHIDATPLLMRIGWYLFKVNARYKNGESIATGSEGRGQQGIAVWSVVAANEPSSIMPYRSLFVVGTEQDKEALFNQLYLSEPVKYALNQKAFEEFFAKLATTRPANQGE